MNPAKPESARVFFALWPDEQCAGRLGALARDVAARLGGRAMQKDTLHLTLAFVGEVSEACLPELIALGDAVAQAMASPESTPADERDAGLILVDRLGYWKNQGILWAGSERFPHRPGVLADRLGASLTANGYAVASRPFAPHVTLLRRVTTLPPPDALDALTDGPIAWPYHDFVLLRSRRDQHGPAYERLGCWRL
jgi:2'-5' RNA ligase